MRYRIDRDSTGERYVTVDIHDYNDRVLIGLIDDQGIASITIDRNDFLETIRTILKEND